MAEHALFTWLITHLSRALTLTISIVASLITAVFITRWLLYAICNLGVKNERAYTR